MMDFTFTPDAGYAVQQVSVNGASQGTPTSYTASGLTQATTLQMTFASPLAAQVSGTQVDAIWMLALLGLLLAAVGVEKVRRGERAK